MSFELTSSGLPEKCIDQTHLKENSGIVTSVNNVVPDSAGNVQISTNSQIFDIKTKEQLDNITSSCFISGVGITDYPELTGVDWNGIHLCGNNQYTQLIFPDSTNIVYRVKDGAEWTAFVKWPFALKSYITNMWAYYECGYIEYSNGYIDQWGRTDSITGKRTVTLHKQYSSGNSYSISLGNMGYLSDIRSPQILNQTASNFVIYVSNGAEEYSSEFTFWRTIGH